MGGLTKILIGGLSVTGILAIVFVVLYATKSTDIPDQPEYTKEQIAASARILNTMDETADPCNDFWQYSCGGWLERNVIPSSKGRLASFDECDDYVSAVLKQELENVEKKSDSTSIEKSKKFYISCMDNEKRNDNQYSVKQMYELSKNLGGWPISGVDPKPDSDSFKLDDVLYNFLWNAGSQPVLRLYTGVDVKHVENHLITVDQPGLLLGSTTNYEAAITNETSVEKQNSIMNLKKAYTQYLTDFAFYYCTDSDSVIEKAVECNVEEIEAQSAEVYALENEISSIMMSYAQRSSNDSLTYNKKSIAQFKSDHGATIGDAVMNLISMTYNETVEVDKTTEINDASEDFFTSLNGWVNDKMTKDAASFIEQLQNMLIFRSMTGLVQALPDKYLKAEEVLLEARMGTTSRPDRYQTCTELSNDAMTFPVGSLYVQRAFAEESKDKIEAMIYLVEKVFKGPILDQADWMDADTKEQAIEKANKVLEFIGYPPYILPDHDDYKQMDEEYNDFNPTEDQFFNNLLNGSVRKYRQSVQIFPEETDRSRWSTGPAIVNAWYSPTRNTITFPAGILQAPFYDAGASTASNYGAIGTVIGHELTHGFDDQGAHYDGTGNKEEWWSESSKEAFEKNGNCMADQYSSYEWDLAGGMHVNGRMTLGENIADNGGIRESFYAYQDWAMTNDDVILPGLEHLSFEKQFFLGFSQVWCAKYTPEEAVRRIEEDVHSPNPFRVQGPLSNFEEFGIAFGCQKSKDLYYPVDEDTCQVW